MYFWAHRKAIYPLYGNRSVSRIHCHKGGGENIEVDRFTTSTKKLLPIICHATQAVVSKAIFQILDPLHRILTGHFMKTNFFFYLHLRRIPSCSVNISAMLMTSRQSALHRSCEAPRTTHWYFIII